MFSSAPHLSRASRLPPFPGQPFALATVSRATLQSKAFLSAHPLLSQKLQKAIVANLASGETHIGAETRDIPSDPAFPIAASSENIDAEDTTAVAPEVQPGQNPENSRVTPENSGVSSENSGGQGSLASGAGGSSSAPAPRGDGGEVGEGVLLEPGVASVAELFDPDVLTKKPVNEGGKGSDVGGGGEGAGKEELRA